MKQKFLIVISLFLVASTFSCKQKAPVSSSETGYVADATMNNIMLVTANGDTLNISTMDTDPNDVPGVLINDSVEITFAKEKIGENEILKAKSLKIIAHSPYYYIQGTWLEPNPINLSEKQGITLKEDGSAVSVGMATLLFEKWQLLDDKLLLTNKSIGSGQTIESIDTLYIVKLNADSLVLSQAGSITWRLGREK